MNSSEILEDLPFISVDKSLRDLVRGPVSNVEHNLSVAAALGPFTVSQLERSYFAATLMEIDSLEEASQNAAESSAVWQNEDGLVEMYKYLLPYPGLSLRDVSGHQILPFGKFAGEAQHEVCRKIVHDPGAKLHETWLLSYKGDPSFRKTIRAELRAAEQSLRDAQAESAEAEIRYTKARQVVRDRYPYIGEHFFRSPATAAQEDQSLNSESVAAEKRDLGTDQADSRSSAREDRTKEDWNASALPDSCPYLEDCAKAAVIADSKSARLRQLIHEDRFKRACRGFIRSQIYTTFPDSPLSS